MSRVNRRQSCFSRPASYWDVVCYHFPLALVTGVPLLLSFNATPEALPLISCTFKGMTGYPCPFCGFTRSFFAMASGDWFLAFLNCPLGAALFIFCVLVFICNMAGLVSGLEISIAKVLKFKAGKGKYVVSIVSLLFLANWVYRLIEGLK